MTRSMNTSGWDAILQPGVFFLLLIIHGLSNAADTVMFDACFLYPTEEIQK